MPHSNYDTEVKAFRKFCKREIEVLKLDRITISDNCNAKLNIRIQKFFIYSHNLDLENALKYHQKLTDYSSEMLEIFAEENEDLTFTIAKTGETEGGPRFQNMFSQAL